MPNTHTTLTSLFDDIADEIRVKLPTGDSEKSSEIVADTFDTAISRILTPADGSIPSKGSETFNTSTSDRTISAGQYLSGNQTIKAVETSGISAGNIKDGVTVKVGDANDDDRIAGVTGTFSKSSTITGSGKSAASAGNILTGKAAFLDGAQLNGTMPNNGATGTTITTQGGTYTIPAGYTSGGTVTASIAASTLDDSIISGEAVIEATDDYAWRTTVNIPAGFYNAQTLTKDFGSIFPAPSTEGTSSDMLAGYELFDHAGRKITGTMPNNSTTGGVITTQGGTYSIPAGYTSGGTVTASINNAVITSGTGSATISDPSYNSSTGKFTQSASGTVSAPSVGTAGYISSVAGTKNPSTLSGSKTLNKVGTGVDITGTTTKQPSIARGTPASGDGWTDAASGSATTSKPSSGVYVKVSSPANTGTLTATPKVTSEGYGTTANGQYSSTASTATVGASASADTYVPITGGTAGTPIATKGTVSSHQVTVTPSVTNVTGWITGSTKNGSAVTVKASDLVSGNLPLSSGTSSQTDIDVTNYATVSISAIDFGSINTSDSDITGGTFTPTLTYNSSTGKFNYGGSANATGTAYAKVSSDGYVTSSDNKSKSLSATVSATGSLDKVATGVDITGANTKKPSISRTAKPSGDAWVDAASGASTTTKPTSAVPYVRVDTAANTGTLTATPKVTSAGYGTTSYYGASAGTATVGASASDPTYVPITIGSAGTPSASKGSVSSHSITVTPSVTNTTGWITGSTKTGTGVTVSASELVSGNKALSSGTSSQTDIDVTNYATVSISAIGGGSHSGSISTHSFTNPTVTPSIGGTSTSISSTTKPSGTDGTDYWTLDPGGSVTTNGSSVAKAKAIIDTAGYISTDSGESSASTITINSDRVSIAAGTNRYISKATSSSTQPTASATAGTASIVNQPSASASTSVTGMVTTSTNTGYIVSASASANSGNSTATGGSASTTAGSVTVGAGYNPSAVTVSVAAKSASGTSATSTAVSDSSSSTKYIQKGILGAGVSVSGGSASIAATGFTGSSSATSHYVTLSTSAGSATGSASVSTEGYVKNETASSGATSVSVSGNGNKIYIPDGSVTTSASLNWSSNQVTITPYSGKSAGYIDNGTDYGSDITITASNLVSGNRALSSAVGNQTGIDVTNYATVSISGIGSGALSTSDSSISGNSFTPSLGYNSSTGKFDYSGSANATGTAYAKASTAGYVSSSNNVSKSLSATVSATGSVNKVGTGVDITGTTTKQPSISRGTPASGDGWTDASSGSATTTKPSSGVYVKVYSSANTGTLTATPKVTSNGYGTTSYYGSSAGTATVGASASADTYIPITGGTAGTPSASKGTVSNHSVSVTPSVTNTTGWITGSTKTGTAVSVSASELVSGNKALSSGTSNQTGIDVTNYATVSISAIGSGTAGTPTATKGTVSSNQVTVTPSVTNTTGYITGSTITGTGVVVKASELVSGNKSLSSGTSNQTGIDVTNYSTVSISAIASGTAGTPSASKGSVSNHSISVTPSVTNTTGYITGGTKTGTAVTVSASELVSGNLALSSSTSAQTGIDVTNYSTVSIAAYVLDIATLAQTKAAVGLS